MLFFKIVTQLNETDYRKIKKSKADLVLVGDWMEADLNVLSINNQVYVNF